ncbi:hypothetical protein BW730_11080 [Tessaracoccus aquimaris]|uniref:acylphosphatase n=1 Tax=Tessaracoccus aquimaris TaxID=1332264 RepID=A0A1Q2CPB5_9ACTN|nr:acylphosphatase [Tessaracoccus aquimaris]AQP47952.1 hypothetical protein BW730_11080 [Tessaracoccus aquimaris]
MTVLVFGQVQGVGFRWATGRQLDALALVGDAENLHDGSVRVTASGDRAALQELLDWLEGPMTPGRVRAVRVIED